MGIHPNNLEDSCYFTPKALKGIQSYNGRQIKIQQLKENKILGMPRKCNNGNHRQFINPTDPGKVAPERPNLPRSLLHWCSGQQTNEYPNRQGNQYNLNVQLHITILTSATSVPRSLTICNKDQRIRPMFTFHPVAEHHEKPR
ncbi:hypothetical protein TNCT_399621 [Trichonephila clavata]|uniref:Uncharacterized protein n=1 Tax=Trichonephila clavata TaxID=2740835 RepID=A0A8X6LIT5_TRICU|nr:hypothetical protein TNCT_399621 [Trichonephila clavata]